MPKRIVRIGQIVPSSNTTMETEIPAILRARELRRNRPESFHLPLQPDADEEGHQGRTGGDGPRQHAMCGANLPTRRSMWSAMPAWSRSCRWAPDIIGNPKRSCERCCDREGRDVSVITSAGALVDELKRSGVRSIRS